MRPIATDLKVLVGRLGPVVSKALEGAIKRALNATHGEVTPDHLLRALLDMPDCDLCVSMSEAKIERKDVVARLDWNLGRLPGKHEGKPRLSHALCLLLEDASKLTKDPVRSGHVAAALLADRSLSAADMAKSLDALPRLSLHLLASRTEDRGEVGRILSPAPAANAPAEAAAKSPAESEVAAKTPAPAEPIAKAPEAAKPAETAPQAAAPSVKVAVPETAAPAEQAPRRPANVDDLRTLFADRLLSEDALGLTLRAHVVKHETTLRLEWDVDARVVVLRIALPGQPPADAVRTAVALSTLNNAIPHGAFVSHEGRLAFRSHVFLDVEGNVPVEMVAFATRMCEEAAEALQ